MRFPLGSENVLRRRRSTSGSESDDSSQTMGGKCSDEDIRAASHRARCVGFCWGGNRGVGDGGGGCGGGGVLPIAKRGSSPFNVKANRSSSPKLWVDNWEEDDSAVVRVLTVCRDLTNRRRLPIPVASLELLLWLEGAEDTEGVAGATKGGLCKMEVGKNPSTSSVVVA